MARPTIGMKEPVGLLHADLDSEGDISDPDDHDYSKEKVDKHSDKAFIEYEEDESEGLPSDDDYHQKVNAIRKPENVYMDYQNRSPVADRSSSPH